MSTDPEARSDYGPFLPGFKWVPFGDAQALEAVFKECGKKVAAFLAEPIQGEAGVVVPPEGYLTKVRELCTKYNVLFIADEIQTGLARSGKMLASDWEPCRPDMVILGKALGGGFLPVSCVLADNTVMDVFQPGTHGSTFGGNPLSSAVAMASLKVLVDEKLADNAEKLGKKLRADLTQLQKKHSFVTTVRGKGLLNAIVLDPKYPKSAWDFCVLMSKRGLLAKPTHEHIIRLAPPLVISAAEMEECRQIIADTMDEFSK